MHRHPKMHRLFKGGARQFARPHDWKFHGNFGSIQTKKKKKEEEKEKEEEEEMEEEEGSMTNPPQWLNVWGSFFREDDPMRPTDDIMQFIKDMKYTEFMKLFNDLEDGQVLENKEFVAWLHPDFIKNHTTRGLDEQYVVQLTEPPPDDSWVTISL